MMDRLSYLEARLSAIESQVFGASSSGSGPSSGDNNLLSAHAELSEGLQQLHSSLGVLAERAPVYPECSLLTAELRARLRERDNVMSGLQEKVDELMAERGQLERFADVLVLLESSSAQSCFDMPPGAGSGAAKQRLAAMDADLATLAEEVAEQSARTDSFLDRYEALVALASDLCIKHLVTTQR